ncbi:MAG: CRTAC1 family protein [Planctomycetaceae bacterium]|nr:CRTAC1 family protein [Planctomycetaceae bacterium]
MKPRTSIFLLPLATFSGLLSGCTKSEPTDIVVLPTESALKVDLPPDLLKTLTDPDATQPNRPETFSAGGTTFRFRELGPESGFSFTRFDDMRGQRRILEVNGGGAGMIDFDLDGRLDVFMTNGCRLPLAEDQRETPGKLFRNQGQMKFSDCSESSTLMQYGFACGCAVADTNEDGFEELYVTSVRGNQFWVNNGDGTFSEVSSTTKTTGGLWGSSAAFADLNGDRNLDLYIANYLDVSDVNPKLCPEPKSPDRHVACTPAMFTGLPDTLYLSNGDGSWVDASSSIVRGEFDGKALGVAVSDLNLDGTPEVFVANDGQPNFLLKVEPAGSSVGSVPNVRITDIGVAANVALNDEGLAQANMGVAVEDFDRDGLRDIFVTHFYRETNTLYRNSSVNDLLLFEDATRRSELGLPSLNHLGFGASSADIDNDGWNDLIVANGHLEDRTWFDKDQPYRMTTQVFQNRKDGTFREVSNGSGEYFQKPRLGRAVATGDLDRDGRSDVVISNQLDPSVILQNETPSGAKSLVLRLIGTSCSRTPIGVRVTVKGSQPVAWQELIGGGSFQSANANELHIGGLPDQPVDLDIHWPDGAKETLTAITPGTWIIQQSSHHVRLTE